MANKIIKYTLNANGTIPDYIDDGGYFPKPNSNASPQDNDIIGATVDGSSETGLGELANEAAIKTYLDSYTGSWTENDPDNPTLENQIAFRQAHHAGVIWAKKIG